MTVRSVVAIDWPGPCGNAAPAQLSVVYVKRLAVVLFITGACSVKRLPDCLYWASMKLALSILAAMTWFRTSFARNIFDR